MQLILEILYLGKADKRMYAEVNRIKQAWTLHVTAIRKTVSRWQVTLANLEKMMIMVMLLTSSDYFNKIGFKVLNFILSSLNSFNNHSISQI